MPAPITRRLFVASATAALCSGCEHTYLSSLPSYVRRHFMKGPDLDLTRAQVEKIPYASLAARLGDGPQVLLILVRDDNEILDWVSHDKEVVVTRRGRVMKTYGLPQDLGDTEFLTPDPVGQPDRDFAAAPLVRTIDIEPQHSYGVVVRSVFTHRGQETLEILGTKFPCDHWEEQAEAPLLDWTFTNDYWVDANSGYVWKSRQYTTPALPPLELEVYRPAP